MSSCKLECESLMSAVLPVAERLLSEQRYLNPFASTLSTAGEITQVGGSAGEGEAEADSATRVAAFQDSFRDGARRGELKATALVSSAAGQGGLGQVVRVQLDHRENYSIIVSFPYSFSSAGELSIDEPFAAEGEHDIFEG
jgi:hypothetical protein